MDGEAFLLAKAAAEVLLFEPEDFTPGAQAVEGIGDEAVDEGVDGAGGEAELDAERRGAGKLLQNVVENELGEVEEETGEEHLAVAKIPGAETKSGEIKGAVEKFGVVFADVVGEEDLVAVGVESRAGLLKIIGPSTPFVRFFASFGALG